MVAGARRCAYEVRELNTRAAVGERHPRTLAESSIRRYTFVRYALRPGPGGDPDGGCACLPTSAPR
jgi:hypothetical protein